MVTRGKVSQLELAYAAGLIDGEGHIGIDKTVQLTQRRVNPRYQAELVFVNSDKTMIDWFHSHFGGSVYTRKKQKDYHKQTWRWKAGDLQAAEICTLLEPYLIGKKRQAQLLIEFVQGKKKPIGRGATLDGEELDRREKLYQEIKAMNDWRTARND